ncbi:Maf family protein [Methylocystis parvus]|uniref:Maf family protein n=1 Tax=Methylocystis parvus TaxID=134 RepID=UPI000591618F|nr:Maf family protein [Methylocystis parvus]WBJ99024.1 Maf family protein [Methylocystis parvus OBBP]
MSENRSSLFWRVGAPLILASKSAGRRQVLAQAGLPFESRPAGIDERAIEASLGSAGADVIAAALARAKAAAISAGAPGRLTLGADQVASCEGRIFGKPGSMQEAAELLCFLSGRRHRLHSAIALFRDASPIFETVAHADLTMRPLSEDFIAAYLQAMGETALTSAGAYQVEGLGAQLFSSVEGDHWTIMGLPILPLLDALRREGALIS